MEEKKKVSLKGVIISCVCAVVWDLNLVLDLVYGYSNKASFVLHILCSIAWSIFAIGCIIRYFRDRIK